MTIRGNKPVGRPARIILALCAAMILIAIVVGVMAVRNQRAFPMRGAASLPAQAAQGGATQPGEQQESQ